MTDHFPVGGLIGATGAKKPLLFSIADNTESNSESPTLTNDVESVLSEQAESGLSLDDPVHKDELQGRPLYFTFSSNTLIEDYNRMHENSKPDYSSPTDDRRPEPCLITPQNDVFLTSSSPPFEPTFRSYSRPPIYPQTDPTDILTTNRTRCKLSATRRISPHALYNRSTEIHRNPYNTAPNTPVYDGKYCSQKTPHREHSYSSLTTVKLHSLNTAYTEPPRRWSYFVQKPERNSNPAFEEDRWTVGSLADTDASIPSPTRPPRQHSSIHLTGNSSPSASCDAYYLCNTESGRMGNRRTQPIQHSDHPFQHSKTYSSVPSAMTFLNSLPSMPHRYSRVDPYLIENASGEKFPAKQKSVRWAGKSTALEFPITSMTNTDPSSNEIKTTSSAVLSRTNISPILPRIIIGGAAPPSPYDPQLNVTEHSTDMGDYWCIHPKDNHAEAQVVRSSAETSNAPPLSPSCIPEKDIRRQSLKRQAPADKKQRMLRRQGRCFTLDFSTQSPPNKQRGTNSPETEGLIEALELLCSTIEESNRSIEMELRDLEPLTSLRRRRPIRTISDSTPYRTSMLTSRNVRARGQRFEQTRRSGGHRRSEEVGQNRSDKVAVEVRVVFLKIGEIDTLKELYYADAFIQAKWREPKLDGRVTEELTITELEQYWNPLLFIDNILSETKETQWLLAQENAVGEVFLVERRRIKGVFLETLELNDFPLDVQDLTITVTTERPETEVDIIPDQNEMSAINIQTFVDQQEWKLHEHVEITKRIIKQEYSSSMKSHPCLSVTCRAARRPGYFYWNVFLIMFMISGLSFATFAVSPDKAELRLRLSFTLILTSVTFKYVITQSLPKISYLTYMDKYVLMSLAILCIISIWHAVVTLLDPQHIAIRNGQSGEFRDTFDFSTPKVPTLIRQNLSRGNANRLKAGDPFANRSLLARTNPTQSNYWTQNHSDSTGELGWNHTLVSTAVLEAECTPTNLMACKEWKEVQKVERHVFTSFVIIYIIAHAVFIFWLYFDASRRRREMRQKDRDYRKRNRKIAGQPTHQ